jgi:hypothetical protein
MRLHLTCMYCTTYLHSNRCLHIDTHTFHLTDHFLLSTALSTAQNYIHTITTFFTYNDPKLWHKNYKISDIVIKKNMM